MKTYFAISDDILCKISWYLNVLLVGSIAKCKATYGQHASYVLYVYIYINLGVKWFIYHV